MVGKEIKIKIGEPILTSFPEYACILSLAGIYEYTDYKDEYINWLSLPFINTMFITKPIINSNIIFDDIFNICGVNTYPFAMISSYNRLDLYKLKVKFNEIFIDYLENGYGIFLGLDQYYIPMSENYRNIHYPHKTFIIGYNYINDCFIIGDFFKGNKYNFYYLHSSNLNNSVYIDIDDRGNSKFNHDAMQIYFLKPQDHIVYPFDKEKLIFALQRWLNGEIIHDDIFGIGDIAKGLSSYNLYIDLLSQDIDVDIRVSHVYYDRYKVISHIINHMLRKQQLSNSNLKYMIDELLHLALINRNSLIKYKISNLIDIKGRVIDRYKLIQENDYEFTCKFINDLK